MRHSKARLITLLTIIIINSVFPIGYKIHKVEADMEPSTITTGYDIFNTRREQQKKVFKNPRGLGYYYALIRRTSTNFGFFKSSDGLAWDYTNVSFDVGGWKGGIERTSFWIWEDESNTRLIIYVAHVQDRADPDIVDISVRAYEIDDGASNPSFLFTTAEADIIEDICYRPSITLDSSGYIWVTWSNLFINKGKQRVSLQATRSNMSYPVTAPSWETVVDVYGEKGSVDYPDGIYCLGDTYILLSDLVPLTAIADVGVVFSYYNFDPLEYKIKAITLTYSAGIQEGAVVVIDNLAHSDMIHSSVVESGVNSDVFIGYKDSGGEFDVSKWDISEPSSATFGTAFASTVDSLALSIDKNASPDKLYFFYVKNADSTDFHYDITEVDTFSLEGETEIDDGSAEDIDYLSSSYQDWGDDGDVQIIYTRQLYKTVRFWGIPPTHAPPTIEIDYFPILLAIIMCLGLSIYFLYIQNE